MLALSSQAKQKTLFSSQGKLIKMFSEQIVTNSRLRNGPEQHIPSLTQWLQVVGLSKDSILGLCQKIASVEELQEKSEHELKVILTERNARPEELSRLCRALHNLKRYTGIDCVLFRFAFVTILFQRCCDAAKKMAPTCCCTGTRGTGIIRWRQRGYRPE